MRDTYGVSHEREISSVFILIQLFPLSEKKAYGIFTGNVMFNLNYLLQLFARPQ